MPVCLEVVRCAHCGRRVARGCADGCPGFGPVYCRREVRADAPEHVCGDGRPRMTSHALTGACDPDDWPSHLLEAGDRGPCLRCGRAVAPPVGGDFSHAVYTRDPALATCRRAP